MCADHWAAQDERDIAVLQGPGAGESVMQQDEVARQRRMCEQTDQGIMEAIVGRRRREDQVRIGFGPALDISVEQPLRGGVPIAWVMALQHGHAPSLSAGEGSGRTGPMRLTLCRQMTSV